ncbi:MAG: plastocyanin/azurin family copper-binding protein [Gemmatimonadaceae bacterium]
MLSRRDFLKAGGLALAGAGLSGDRRAWAALIEPTRASVVPPVQVIEMRSNLSGSRVWFDPIGVFVAPGTTIRWIVRQNVHTTTAYAPRNTHHPLRIPEGAMPWDSGFLVNPGDHFDVTLGTPGVYDYFCAPHEFFGMVGRIIVGAATGPGAEPFDYWVGRSGTKDWLHVPDAARKRFPSIAQILRQHHVHLTADSTTR